MTLRPPRRQFLKAAGIGYFGNQLLSDHSYLFAQEASAQSQTAIGGSVVATVHPLATESAIQAMRDGGNAIDAAIVAATVLGVVDGHNSGLGGGCFLLIRAADGKILAIDGRETAPKAATASMYWRDGKPDTRLSQTGPLAIGIPGQVAAMSLAHQRLGKLPWTRVLEPAMVIAREGYRISKSTFNAISSEFQDIQRFAPTSSILLDPNRNVPKIGEVLKQPDLSSTLEHLSKKGADWFYRGEFAEQVAGHLLATGGIATREDFGDYRAKLRTPLQSSYREYEIVGFPPPSSGGVHVAQMLNMLQHFPLSQLHRESPSLFLHVVAECMKLAFADRAHWLGDPDFASVPRGLIDRDYARQLANRIRMNAVLSVKKHGQPPLSETSFFDDRKHTTHLTTADSQGNWVAMTATVNTTFGSKVIAPGTGVVLNNQMDDFSIAPGVPNAFGLVGAEANAVAPGKRPLSSMSPTIVLDRDLRPILSCGAAGGPRIINTVLQVILRCLDLGESIDQAIAGPRIHHQWQPDRIVYEPKISDESLSELKALGHVCLSNNSIAIAQGIRELAAGKLQAASDPRVQSQAQAIPQ